MVIDEINHLCVGITNRDPGGVDLPQVVRNLSFEPFIRLATTGRLCSDQTVTT
jgi:hypothetical protein